MPIAKRHRSLSFEPCSWSLSVQVAGRFEALKRGAGCGNGIGWSRTRGILSASALLTAGALFRFCEPPTAEFFRRYVGQIWLDVQDGSPVEHVETSHMKGTARSPQQLDNGEPDGIWAARRSRGEHTMRPSVGRRGSQQIVAISTIENPEDIEMGEPLDVRQTCLERRQDLERAFG